MNACVFYNYYSNKYKHFSCQIIFSYADKSVVQLRIDKSVNNVFTYAILKIIITTRFFEKEISFYLYLLVSSGFTKCESFQVNVEVLLRFLIK